MRMSRSVLATVANLLTGICLANLCGGCTLGTPRPRMGTLPTPPPGPRFSDPNKLGKHSYYLNLFEINGIVYTCKAGHVDITHVRWTADNTRYVIHKIRQTLARNKKGFSFNLAWERSKHKIRFTYPENWRDMSRRERKRIADEIAFNAAPHIVFNATLWHEILTWFGVHFAGFEPEFNSSFSWEDMYSNILGTALGVEAVKDPNRNYDDAMTFLINKALRELDVKPRKTAIYAAEKMRGKWFRGTLLVETIKKSMDIGADDGHCTPILVPDICEGAEPEPIAVPNADILSEHGFSMTHEIQPREWERGKIFKVADPNTKLKTVQTDKHFPTILAHIRKEAVEKYHYDID